MIASPVRAFFPLVVLLTLFFYGGMPDRALALTLDEAKSQGLVGEKSDGYLGVVSNSASTEVRKLTDDINGKRREKYQEIAAQNGTPVGAVEALAGSKAVERTEPGRYIQAPSGKWVKK